MLARLVKFPKVEKPARQRIILEMDDWKRIQERFSGTRFYVMLMIGFHTRLRIGEVAALAWDDIDFEKQEINVNNIAIKRAQVYGRMGAWYFSTTKTESSTRIVKIGETLLAYLKEEKARQEANELKYDDYYTMHYLAQEKDEKGNTIYRI